ncbi:MAG: protein kinase [Helicobacteraceae bacterium]|jgi:DNA-binding helix-hairpin-helix protein with protein kinase domain|nr:protein kinase [Helicobacteraceae bacterium]
MANLTIGSSVQTKNFKTAKVIRELGEGGQGKVYEVDYGGERKALKWYFGNRIRDRKKFAENLENNIKIGAPTTAFLWPEDITDPARETFGYIMALRPKEYADFSKFLVGKVAFSGLTAMCNASLNIVAGFRELHNKGYSYQDLNDGNFFINPKNGAVLICDNDNVSAFGKSSGIAGKARYMAPEVVKGGDPDTQSDRFSLSVILFLLWVNSHPLEGKAACPPCMDAKNERRIYGETPIFIFDPNDSSNRPVQGLHRGAIARFPLLPNYLQEKFIKAFSKEVMGDRLRRIIEREWLHLFIRMRGEVYKCACNEVYFADPVTQNGCHKCGKKAPFFGYIKTARYNLPIHQRTKLYACHSHKDDDDFQTQIGQVIAESAGYKLHNQSEKTWQIDQNALEPNNAIALNKGCKIDFGDSKAEII